MKTEYGIPSLGRFDKDVKMTVKMTIVSNGCRTAHPIPITDCLYLVLICFNTKK